MLRATLVAIALAVCLLSLEAAVQAQTSPGPAPQAAHFDPQPWLDDFHELIVAMESHYADLDWAIHDRKMDLPKLRQETEDKLRQATDEQTAQRALRNFLDAFGDGHLEITWPKPAPASPDKNSSETKSFCGRLGYEAHPSPGIDLSLVPGYNVVEGDGSRDFHAGLLRLENGLKLGVLRISTFSEHGFPEDCEITVQEMKLPDDAQCDGDCKNKIERATADRLTAELVSLTQQFRKRGAAGVLVDITHNGGGSDWYEPAVRSLSSVPLTDAHQGFIKHEHWTTELESRLQQVEGDLKAGREPKPVIEKAAATLRNAIARSKESCDRSHAFADGKTDCTLEVDDLLYWSDVLPYAKPGSFSLLDSKTTLFHPLRYTYSDGANQLPLYVVVDRQTWSSAERFASLLQDNSAATIVGELTGGAGCGFTNDGIPTTLSHSHAQVKMPDCVGIRKDGSNGNDGVTPDQLVPWGAHESSYTKAIKLLTALEKPGVVRKESAPKVSETQSVEMK
jgi:hypothetical protein